MDINLIALQQEIINPVSEALAPFFEVTETAKQQLLLIATIGLKRNNSFFQHNNQSYGLFHITAEQHTRLWDTVLVKTPDLASTVRGLASQRQFLKSPHLELCTNLIYATAIALTVLCHCNHYNIESNRGMEQINAIDNQGITRLFPGFHLITQKELAVASRLAERVHKAKKAQQQPGLLNPNYLSTVCA